MTKHCSWQKIKLCLFPSVIIELLSPFLVWMRRLNPFLQFVWININLQPQHKANDKFHWIHHDLQYQNTHISLINKLINIFLLKSRPYFWHEQAPVLGTCSFLIISSKKYLKHHDEAFWYQSDNWHELQVTLDLKVIWGI